MIHTMQTVAATSARITICVDANQSASLPVSSITCIEPTQITSSPSPTPSMGNLRTGVSRAFRLRQHRNALSNPTGTLMKKIQPHVKLSQI
jgi:hypothetical protein